MKKLYTGAREKDYVPFWDGNDKDGDPIVFVLRYLNSAERDECTELTFDPDRGAMLRPDYARFFRKGVAKIKELSVNDVAIETADAFLAIPDTPTTKRLTALMLEVGAEIWTMNQTPELKNLESPST